MTLRLAPIALLLAAAPSVVLGQAVVQPLPGTTDADRLAAQMRIIGADPTNLAALLAAGELSVKLDDLGAAAAFFARAEKVDPHNARAKAGEGAILVHAERPGEALRYFAQAEAAGLAPAAFASDRGLAYDLIGEGERARRDYRLALRTAPDDEARRRYALSLGIAGQRALADEQLEPLLRTSDRAAWRAHAFILAMAGDQAGATRIATTMMPPGTAAGLQPFFQQLPTLGPVDRAFAVHFGELHSTPQRVADARMTPPLPALGPDPYAPRVAVAAAPANDRGKHKDRNRGKRSPVQVAVAAPAPVPLPDAPTYRSAGAPPPASVSTARGAAPIAWPTSVTPSAGMARASAAPSPTRPAPPAETNVVVASTTAVPAPSRTAPPSQKSLAAPVLVAVAIARPTPAPMISIAPPPPAPAPVVVAAAPIASAPPPAAPAAREATAPPPPGLPRSDLSQIVASLPIPAAELGVDGPHRPVLPAASAPAVDQAALDREAERAAAAKALADKRAADRKPAADKKALAAKKAAAEEKAEEARAAAAQKKLERANPERIWVQVAGGANGNDLPKAWSAAKAKGGDLFAGHATGWTTPLRFTNRVLAGPFKTDEEARTFVNKAKAAGLSAFTFTSDAGQVVTRLPAK